MVQPRRLGERPCGIQHCAGGPTERKIRPRQSSARFHQRQYWNCLCHDRRRRRLYGHAVHAGECFRRAQAHSVRLRCEHRLYAADEGSDGAIRVVREMYAKEPEKYFYADQYSNHANWKAHYRGTANEIWQQTEGRITHFISMMGTSGTFMGTPRRLKELNPQVRCISLQPDSPFHGIEGAKHMASAIVPGIYDAALADEDIGISTEEFLRDGDSRLARRGLAGRDLGGSRDCSRLADRAQTDPKNKKP